MLYDAMQCYALGMMLGVAGAVREPLMGLNLGGFSGMATGLFTGWVGLVLRPTYGALMSTSQVCALREGHREGRQDIEESERHTRREILLLDLSPVLRLSPLFYDSKS